MGYLRKEKIQWVRTSHISAYCQNPEGVYQCKNIEAACEYYEFRYVSDPGEIPPDILFCPYCGTQMPNIGLSHRWGYLAGRIKSSSSGTPDIYKLAIDGLDLFLRIYKAEKKKAWDYPEVLPLDIAIDLAPKVFDEAGMSKVIQVLNEANFKHYKIAETKSKFRKAADLMKFYHTIPDTSAVKQVDLVPKFKDNFPDLDPTWIFYIWSNFGLLTRSKEKNRVYLQRVSI